MNGIYIAAFLTTVFAALGFGWVIARLRQPASAYLLWLTALIALPLQPLVFYLVRLPLDRWLSGQLGSASTAYQWLTSLYAPLTEEPAKLAVLLVPAIFRDIRPANFARYALTIGVAFAIGEMWLVAERIARDSTLAALPFYYFAPYAGERLMTCVGHSALVALALSQLRGRFLLGFAGAATAHWAANLPLLLMARNTGGLGRAAWSIIVQCWLVAVLVGAVAVLSYFLTGRVSPARFIFGRRRCPECAVEYDPSLLAINLGPTRYERCPHCRRWHWTRAQPAKPDA